ncbi:riboflavin synthase subunit beta [Winogradskyella sp. PC-19]|uniref:riboflavin synthase subunit beta n=1 Tax=unclassified Winogradskyella TaxID=2615021 RepID=UPI000B3C6BD8|nr:MULTISPECIES: riboflavin synthase subunit beta [unclassified Winogradskyella]ARV10522.1 riboflavin synthase subunit beta [Winogradskyella sp. PC-19]RZN80663.1 MAG: riboflavin synthase subunit beta [Winogradskyella sp.]
MGLLKTKKNKRYNYTPRYYKGEGSPYELKHKFDDYRKTINPAKGIKGKFNAAFEDYKDRDEKVNKRVFIIVGILVLIFLFIIDFDLSIFSKG